MASGKVLFGKNTLPVSYYCCGTAFKDAWGRSGVIFPMENIPNGVKSCSASGVAVTYYVNIAVSGATLYSNAVIVWSSTDLGSYVGRLCEGTVTLS